MHVTEHLQLANVRCKLAANSRKRALELISEFVSDDTLSADTIFDGLMTRERLGSTGLGEGVAIPHCRLACPKMQVAFVSLANPVDFEASDSEYVDLLFVLIVPNEETSAHLQALANLSEIFADPDNRQALRACTSDDELLRTIQQMAAQAA